MNNNIFPTILLFIMGLTPLMSNAQMTYKKETNDSTSHSVRIEIGKTDDPENGIKKDEMTYPRSYGGITFTRVDWGFSRLSDGGSFTLTEQNQFLNYKKASNFGFDIAQYGVRFNDQFKVYLAAGFEWNYWRLKRNILLQEGVTPLGYQELDPAADYSKNILTSTYLRFPITAELRSRKLNSGKRVKLAFGVMTGVLLKGTQRLKSDQYGKQKYKDTYNLQTFQYGPFVRMGYSNFGIFAKYYVNDLFEKSPDQDGVRNLAFGLTLGF